MTFIPFHQQTDIKQKSKGATLLLPAVSTGNVPQLTLDLLLSTLPHELLGTVYSSHVQACVGSDALQPAPLPQPKGKKNKKEAAAAAATASSSPLTTSCQLFFLPTLHALLLQQRAPVFRGHHSAFVQELVQLATEELEVDQVMLLTSSAAFRKAEEELDQVHPVSFYLVEQGGKVATETTSASAASDSSASSSSSSSLLSLLRSTLHWNSLHYKKLEQDEPRLRYEELNAAEELDGMEDEIEVPPPFTPIPVPGLGITRPFFEAVTGKTAAAASDAEAAAPSTASAIPFSTLFLHSYINEGANDKDALLMCHQLYALLYLQHTQKQQQQQGAEAAAASEEKSSKGDKQLMHPQEMIWTPPACWSAVFGNEPEESMYL